MASAKFSAFEFASEEFNSELAQLVNGFTQNLVRIIQEECVRKGNDTDGESSKNSSPFASPTGKAPRKRAPASKRGRPSKEDTDVVIDPVSDMLSASEELLTRAESVRSSSKSPRSPDITPECMESVAVSLDDLMNTPAETTEPAKKGKGKAEKVPKEKKEKAEKVTKEKKEKAEKVTKEKKEKAEKVPKAEKAEKVTKAEKVPKAEKAVKVPKEKKEKAEKVTKGKKGKKGDDTPPVEETLVEDDATPTTTILPEPENVIVEEDDDGVTSETVASSSTHTPELSKLMALANVLATAELDEENDYAKTQILDKIEGIINSQGSQDDDIASQHGTLVEDMDNEINIDDEFSENGDDEGQDDDEDDDTPPPADDDEL